MSRRTIAIFSVALGLAVLGLEAGAKYYFCTPRVGAITDSFTSTGPSFQVRVLRRAETGAYLPGAYYEFASRPSGDDQWHEIMTVRHDDPVEIPTDRVRYVTEQIGYVSMCWQYAVTTDGGRTWSVWDASKTAELRNLVNYGLIDHVSLGADGKGTMTLNSLAASRGGLVMLCTVDYGRTWIRETTPN